MTPPSVLDVVATSPQQRRAVALCRVAALAPALENGWTLLRLAIVADATTVVAALHAVCRDEIFAVELVTPAGARTAFQRPGAEAQTEIRVDDRVADGRAWARRLARERTAPGIMLAAAPAGEDRWWLLVRAGATHMDLGSAFEVARRIVEWLAAGKGGDPPAAQPSYLDAADALDELAIPPAVVPSEPFGRTAVALGHVPRTVHTVPLGDAVAQSLGRLGRNLGVGWDAAALAAWTRLILMRGDRSGACALGVDGRVGELAPVIGPLAWSEVFAPVNPGAVDLRGMAALAHGAIQQARGAVVPATVDGDAPPLWSHAFETIDLSASPRGVALIESTVVIEPAPVTLRAVTGPDWYDLTLVYDSARVDIDAVTTLAARLAAVATTTALDLPLRHLPATIDADRLLADAVNQRAAAGLTQCESVGERLAALARAHPEAPALATMEGDVSYAALFDQARRVASVLADRDIGLGGSVGVAMDRGVALYATLCGILLAGARYVPIDPDTPAERLAQLVGGGAVDLLVSSTPAVAAVAGACRVGCITADALAHAVAAASPSINPLTLALPPSSPAYMIYTSGTTGGPKGVLVSHRALINYADAVAARLGIAVGTRLAALSTYAADLSYTALWGGLLSGGCVCCLPIEATLDALKLADGMQRLRVDWLKIVPAHWRALAANADDVVVDRLIPRIGLVFGGDVLPAAAVASLRAARPRLRVVNHYGPTETTVGALAYDVDGTIHDKEEGEILPIGTPLTNMRALVANARGEEIDIGNEGMLLIGGPGVAIGYRGAPALTADRFRPSRHGPAGERIYRTGDRARRLPDGAIAFLGRADDQLKLRGFRVEPQEVATAIRAVSDIRDVAVVADAGVQALLAFVVPHPLGIDIDALHRRLSSMLPAHAIPREIHVVRSLPLMRNGKIDRAALLIMAAALQDRRVVAPRTPLEAAIVDIWREALGTTSIGVDENFFALGGHSLLATQILSRIRQRLSVEITIADFFACPTIEGLAARVATSPDGQDVALEPRAAMAPALLSLGQERLWFLTRTGQNQAAYNNAYALSVRGPLDPARLGRAVSAVIARHVALRMGVVENDGVASAIVVAPSIVAPCVHDLTMLSPAARDEAVANHLAAAASAPFDLSDPPLLRVQVLQTGVGSAVIGLVVHHIVWDGWSNAVFTRELFAAYDGDDGAVPAPPLALDYLDHVAAERRWAHSTAADEQLGYWAGRLAPIPPLDLGVVARDGPAGAGELTFAIDRQLVDALHARASMQGATEFMALLAAYFVALWREGGQTSFAVGTSVSNRTSAATESMIGYFVNQVALCADLKGNPTMADLLDRVRRDAVAAFSASTIPFGTIVSRLRREREAGRTPVFQTMLVRQAGAAAQVVVGDLLVEPRAQGDVQARFDVTLYVGDGPDGLTGTFVYDTAALSPAVIGRLRDGFLEAARLIATEPHAHLSRLGHRGAATTIATPTTDRRRFVPGMRRAVSTVDACGIEE